MKITKYIKAIKYKDRTLNTYFILVILRVLLIFIPQTGFIHPDEFFQSIEIITGEEFDLEHTTPWEFNNTYPIRSMVVPYFTMKIPLTFLKLISMYLKYYLQIDIRTSYMLLIYPRLIICILSFANDWSLYKICQTYGLRYEIRLLALGSSFVMLIFGTRTFSNTIEMTICSVLLYFVSDCMIHSNTVIYKKEYLQERYQNASSIGEKVKLYKLKSSLPSHTFNRVLIMSTLCVIGVFNRPTFLLFGAPIVFFWLLRGIGTRTVSFIDFNLRITLFCVCAIPSIFLFILIDSFYYGYLTTGEIAILDIGINNFVFTPWNFIKYNIDPEKTAEHGIHPRYLHLLVNIPLLYNILGFTAIFSFGILVHRFLLGEYKNLPRSQSIVGLMSSSIFVPLAILSLINHQEPRFLIPLTLPIILLHSPKFITGFCTSYPFKIENWFLRFLYNNILCTRVSSKYLMKIWYTMNIILAIFFGFIHQGGVFHLAEHFSNIMKMKPNHIQLHLITSHIYNVPISFVNIPSSEVLHVNPETYQKYRRNKQFFIYEYGSIDLDNLYKRIKLILDVCEMKAINHNRKYQLYLAIPSSLSDDLYEAFYRNNNTIIKFEQIKIFYPHLSIEAMPKFVGRHICDLHVETDDLLGTCEADTLLRNDDFLSISYMLKMFSSIIHQFGLVLYRIDIDKHNI